MTSWTVIGNFVPEPRVRYIIFEKFLRSIFQVEACRPFGGEPQTLPRDSTAAPGKVWMFFTFAENNQHCKVFTDYEMGIDFRHMDRKGKPIKYDNTTVELEL